MSSNCIGVRPDDRMNSQEKVSIIICTRDRAESLRETLAAIGRCEVPADLRVELLVIDNGSADATRTVTEGAEVGEMRLRYVREERAGLDYARNRGLAEAAGTILLFVDDDVRPAAGWIEGMCRPILDGEADAVQGGIAVAAHLIRPWQKGVLRQFVASTPSTPSTSGTPGTGRRVMGENEGFTGANMAVHRRVLEKVRRFDVELDSGNLRSGEDTLFSLQVQHAGFRRLAVWDACVEHHFSADRMTEASLIKDGWERGRSSAYFRYHWEHETFHLAGARLWWVRLKRFCREAIMRRDGDAEAEPRPWRIGYAKEIGFWEQYRKECRRLHNYEKFGLVKVGGVLA